MSSTITAIIMNQLVTDLASGLRTKNATFYADIEASRTVYLSPNSHWVKSAAPIEIQVIRGEDQFLDQEGFLRIQTIFRIFVLRKMYLDATEKHYKALSDTANSLYRIRDDIISVLHGKYLGSKEELLVRPLLLTRISEVKTSPEDNDTLGMSIDFIGGTNANL